MSSSIETERGGRVSSSSQTPSGMIPSYGKFTPNLNFGGIGNGLYLGDGPQLFSQSQRSLWPLPSIPPSVQGSQILSGPSFRIPGSNSSSRQVPTITYKEIPCQAFGKARKGPGGMIRKEWNGVNMYAQEPPKRRIYLDRGLTYFSTQEKLPMKNSFGKMTELEYYSSPRSKHRKNFSKRFRFYSNMVGFEDDEITFFVQGKIFLIQGFKRKRKSSDDEGDGQERKVTEAIGLPRGIRPDNFRVARDEQGVIHFEEAWLG